MSPYCLETKRNTKQNEIVCEDVYLNIWVGGGVETTVKLCHYAGFHTSHESESKGTI